MVAGDHALQVSRAAFGRVVEVLEDGEVLRPRVRTGTEEPPGVVDPAGGGDVPHLSLAVVLTAVHPAAQAVVEPLPVAAALEVDRRPDDGEAEPLHPAVRGPERDG